MDVDVDVVEKEDMDKVGLQVEVTRGPTSHSCFRTKFDGFIL